MLKQILQALLPVDPNENELEMAKEDILFEKYLSEEQLDKEDSDWITEL